MSTEVVHCSVIKSCLTLCDPVDCSTPGFPVLHQLLELLKLMSTHVELVMPSNHLILCCSLLLLPAIFPSIRVSFNELAKATSIKWLKNWSFSFSSSNEYAGLISFRLTGLISLLSKGFSRVFSSTTVQKD